MPFMNTITGDHQCEFHYNTSTIDKSFAVHKYLDKKLDCNGYVY